MATTLSHYAHTAANTDRYQLFLDQVIDFTAHNRKWDTAAETALGVKRIRNLLTFSLSRDYRCNKKAFLSKEDQEHFKTMSNLIVDSAHAAKSIGVLACERQKLAPYFWKHLHEPCQALDIPVETVLVCLDWVYQHHDFSREYNGCCFDILKDRSVGPLAAKLYVDQHILIPRVIENLWVRHAVYQALCRIRALYFHAIIGTVGPADVIRTWSQLQRVSYQLTNRGKIYSRLWQNGSKTALIQLAVRISADKARQCWVRPVETAKKPRPRDPAAGQGGKSQNRLSQVDSGGALTRESSEGGKLDHEDDEDEEHQQEEEEEGEEEVLPQEMEAHERGQRRTVWNDVPNDMDDEPGRRHTIWNDASNLMSQAPQHARSW